MADKLERIYTVPLGKAYETIRTKRTIRAVNLLRAFIIRHMKAENVIISNALNSFLWQHSMPKPPRKVKVRAVREDQKVRVFLSDEKEEKKEENKAAEKKETKKTEEKKAEKKPEEKKTAVKAEEKKTEA